jgi:hypothetical protein
MSRFAAMKAERQARPQTSADPASDPAPASNRPAIRQGKKAISGYFSLEVSRALHMLALDRETSLQALMGEAFDDLLRKYDKHPFGER